MEKHMKLGYSNQSLTEIPFRRFSRLMVTRNNAKPPLIRNGILYPI